MKKIIFGAANYWSSPYQVGSHHYAREFVKNNWQVAFISDAISPFHFLAKGEKKQLKERFNIFLKGGQWLENKKVWAYVPFTFCPVYNKMVLKSDWALARSHKLFFPPLKKKLKDKGFNQVDVIWLDSVKQYYLLDLIKHQKSVLRIADKNQGNSRVPKSLVKKEKELIKKVDAILVSSKILFQEIKKIRKQNVFYLSNGVDFEYFKNSPVVLPKEYEKIPSPRVIYVGAIEKWFDLDLFYFLAQKLKNVSFVIIGLPKINLKKINDLSNVFILGPKNHQTLPSYLRFCQAGIIPFKKNELTDYITPIKLFEYFSSGLPVVSVNLKETEALNSPALLAQNNQDFLDKLRSLVVQPVSEKEKFYEFAQNHTWEKNFEFLLKNIL